MRLVVTTGSQAGRTLDVERRLLVGRDEACDLALEDDEKASRRHCAFSPNPDGTLTVEDLGSSNGTLVDGTRISAPVALRGGEEVRVGTTVFRIEREPAEQATLVAGPATVVRAPATQLASGPPPGEPPVTPPPAPERPWWRSKWAVIGGAVALLAIGGIVGGVLAASGGGDDDPVAVATTDEQPTDEQTVTEAETETQTETETVETEQPPETGATETGVTETGVTDENGLTALELGLLTYVPEPLQASCQGYEPAAEELVAGRVTGLYCPTGDGIELYYDSYDSKESMDSAYAYAVGDIPSGEGDCSAAFPAEGTYTIGDDPGGRVVCFEGGEPVAPIIWWTTDAINVLASAAWEGHTAQELYDWWATEPGPLVS